MPNEFPSPTFVFPVILRFLAYTLISEPLVYPAIVPTFAALAALILLYVTISC